MYGVNYTSSSSSSCVDLTSGNVPRSYGMQIDTRRRLIIARMSIAEKEEPTLKHTHFVASI